MSHTLEELNNMKADRKPSDRCVYFHVRSDTEQVFYIGMGGKERAYKFSGKKTRNQKWRKIVKICGKPKVLIIAENLTIDKAAEIEKFWIKFYGLENLANQSLGGEGSITRIHSHETKLKISAANKGRKLSQELKAQTVSAANRKVTWVCWYATNRAR